jgi:diguanylate cyclase (GGDEF)-like protein
VKPSVSTRMAAFQAGADDYLEKPVLAEELFSRVKVRIERAGLLAARMDHDALTGLLSRRALVQQLDSSLAAAQRRNAPFTLSLLDLDQFKTVNDTRGHLAGDRVLAGLGALLAARFRRSDIRGRFGGEEFLLAFPDEVEPVVRGVLERLLKEFKALTFLSDGDEPFQCSFTAGLATSPDDGKTVQALLKVADARLYAAKRAGRSRVLGTGGG